MKSSQRKTLIVIPARGGSKGIPRKNLRPLNGRPLLAYAVEAAKAASNVSFVCVTTEDDEIELLAERLNVNVLKRPAELACDDTPLDPVVQYVYEQAKAVTGIDFDNILTVQPTSPLVSKDDIESAVALLNNGGKSVVSVSEDTHLRWGMTDGKPTPLYEKRVNRQLLPREYRETGAIIGCRKEVLASGTRVSSEPELLIIPKERSVDIDSMDDLLLCEAMLQRKKVVFVVIGKADCGLGHVYRALTIAHHMTAYDLMFLVPEGHDLAHKRVSESNYSVRCFSPSTICSLMAELSPDLVINDCLDTSVDYMQSIRKFAAKVVNFEDMGPGAMHADIVINELYPHQQSTSKVHVGHMYSCLRDEFALPNPVSLKPRVERILITFGGVDEGDLTGFTLRAISDIMLKQSIKVDVVTGPGFSHIARLEAVMSSIPEGLVTHHSATKKISAIMRNSDLAVCSGGRTVIELASMAVPTIVICQNERETKHSTATEEFGVVNLGLRTNVSEADVHSAVRSLTLDLDKRLQMHQKALGLKLSGGTLRVVRIIHSLLNVRSYE